MSALKRNFLFCLKHVLQWHIFQEKSQKKKYTYIVKLKFDMEDFNLGATWNVQHAIDLEKQV